MAIYKKGDEYQIVRGPDSGKGMRKPTNNYLIGRALRDAIGRLMLNGELTRQGELTDIGRSNAAIYWQRINMPVRP